MQLLPFPFNIQMEKYRSSIPILKQFHLILQTTKIFFYLQKFLQFRFQFAQFCLVVYMWLYFQLYFVDLYHILYGGNLLKNISIGRLIKADSAFLTLFILARNSIKGFSTKSTICLNCLCLLKKFQNLKGFMNISSLELQLICIGTWSDPYLIR